VPEFTVIAAPEFQAVPERDGTNSGAFILADFTRKIVLIGRNKICRRDKEVYLRRDEFHRSRQGCAAHALLGECGRGMA